MIKRESGFIKGPWGLFFVAAILVAAGGCATTSAGVNQAVPRNYRQLVAEHLGATGNWSGLLKAEISKPGVWADPTGLGPSRPIVCARLVAQGPLAQQTSNVGYMFENGQIDHVFYPGGYNPMVGMVVSSIQKAITCDKLSYTGFPELMRLKR